MTDHFKKVLLKQLEASLGMLEQCIEACPDEFWEGQIASDSARQIIYHTLFFADFYLSPNEEAFTLRDINHKGGDERGPTLSAGLSRDETLAYVTICRQKAIATLNRETEGSLSGPSGFARRMMSRAELHVHYIRHIQHHAGQFSAYLRRVVPALKDPGAMPWIDSGWRKK